MDKQKKESLSILLGILLCLIFILLGIYLGFINQRE